MPQKSDVLHLLHVSYDEADRFIAGMSAAERDNSGAVDQWAARDILAHIYFWQRYNAQRLAALRTGSEPPEDPGEGDEANAKIFQQHVHESWNEIADFIAQARQMFLPEVEALSQEALSSTTYSPWSEGRPLWREVLGDGFIHSISHLAQAYIDRGDFAEAERLSLQQAELLSTLDPDPQWQGVISYNLACHYALVGNQEKALKYLEAAFQKRPNLADWSQQDTDLRSLHDNPDFVTLVNRYK